MKWFLFTLALIPFLVGCNSNPPKKITFVNPKYMKLSAKQEKAIFNKHLAQCKQEALTRVHYPQISEATPYNPMTPYANSVGGAFSYGMIEGSRKSTSSIYRSQLNAYTYACIQGKGWEKH